MEDRGFLPAVLGFYGMLGVTACLWMWGRDQPLIRVVVPGSPESTWLQIAVGLGVGLLTVAGGRVIERRFAFAQRLAADIAQTLPSLGPGAIIMVAVCSSVGEELFFRGAMQDVAGLWVTAGVFGVVHGFFERRYLWWMVFASVMGLVFGAMTAWLGSILAPTLAHFTVNALNIHQLVQRREQPV
ncbi:MAG: membrane protease YdiL (CAAX protease family) [Myxococcota bacterium]|jgi:membrane protease YdiL (CAAX protease family)